MAGISILGERYRDHANSGPAVVVVVRAKAPMYECFTSSTLDSDGLGEVMISRKSASGEIAMGVFLIDRYCMGVKDCFGRLVSGAEFEDFKEKLRAKGLSLKKIDASSARRLIEDAIAYAEDLGIKPHSDFRSARVILGDIDPSEATTLFEMGKDGKPYFMSGPYQSPAECQMFIAKLTAKCGADGFHYVMAIDPGHELLTGTHFDELSFDDDTDEFDDEDEVIQSSVRLEDMRS